MINGICKKCGKLIPIPEEISEFSCMYCGRKLTKSDLLISENRDPARAREYFDAAVEKIPACVLEHRDIVSEFTREEYASSFKKYMKSCFRTFDTLNSAAILDPENGSKYVRTAADTLLSELEADWEKQPGWSTKKGRRAIIDGDKMVIALYLVPTVGKLSLSVSDEFNTYLNNIWMEKYPKSPFYIGDYDKISDSYYSRLHCYITTAVCRSEGKPDDCRELELLRSFRDGWLAKTEEGRELINEYYRLAPKIVTCMELTGGDYGELNRRYIAPCVEDIEAGRNERCRDRYVSMVRELERRYLKM